MENTNIKEEQNKLLEFFKTQGEVVTIQLDIRDLYRTDELDPKLIEFRKMIKDI